MSVMNSKTAVKLLAGTAVALFLGSVAVGTHSFDAFGSAAWAEGDGQGGQGGQGDNGKQGDGQGQGQGGPGEDSEGKGPKAGSAGSNGGVSPSGRRKASRKLNWGV